MAAATLGVRGGWGAARARRGGARAAARAAVTLAGGQSRAGASSMPLA